MNGNYELRMTNYESKATPHPLASQEPGRSPSRARSQTHPPYSSDARPLPQGARENTFLSFIRHSSFVIRNCRLVALAIFLSAQFFISDVHASPWPNDPDFLVGAAGHMGAWPEPGIFPGYGASDAEIEKEIHLLAEMGAKIYRLDNGPVEHMKNVVSLCEKYGIAVMLIVSSLPNPGSDRPSPSAEATVKGLKGRVKYYQINNEMSSLASKDFWTAGTERSELYNNFWMSTDKDGNPNPEKLPDDKIYLDKKIAETIDTIKFIRREDPHAKVLINTVYTHYAFLDYAFEEFKKAGVDIDLIGWDWYAVRERVRWGHESLIDGFNSVAKFAYDRYGKDIIICEYNMWIPYFDIAVGEDELRNHYWAIPFLPGNDNGKIDLFEEDNMDTLIGPYLINNIKKLYNNGANKHIKGIMIYELIDEPEKMDPHWTKRNYYEEKFGLTYSKALSATQSKYQLLGPKKAYYDVQKLLGGGFVPIKRLKPSAAIPEYTITASVIDEGTDGTVLSSQAGGTVSGSGIYRENSVVTLTAAANTGYEFLGWYRGGIRISRNPVYKFTAYDNADNIDRNSAEGKFAYEARYVFSGACEGEVITFPVKSKNGVQNTGTLIIPAKTFGTNVKIDAQQYVSLVPAAKSYVRELSRAYIAAIIAAPGKNPEREMELRLPYNSSDITGMNEDTLVISKYDEEKNMWVPLKSNVDNVNKQIIAYIDKLSLYAIMGTTNTVKAFENVKYYPNPIQPSKGMSYAKMSFSNMPASTRIKIYTMLGRVVRDLESDANGMAVWDGRNNAGEKVASGIYIAYMEDKNGNKKRIKIAVER